MAIKEAVGIIETLGLAAAIESADAMVKSANVKLIGYELTKGYGWVTVKIRGDVGAVNAAIAAGCTAASKVSKVISTLVLPRPHDDLDGIINSHDNVCNKKNNIEKSDISSKDEVFETIEYSEEIGTEEKINIENNKKEDELSNNKDDIEENVVETEKIYGQILEDNTNYHKKSKNKICNLCGDELCPREKGQPHDKCIHIDDSKKEV